MNRVALPKVSPQRPRRIYTTIETLLSPMDREALTPSP